jgi:hypothetical protein
MSTKQLSQVFKPDVFFEGSFKGSGVMLSRSGSLRRQFTLTGSGVWSVGSKTLNMTEAYFFNDGQIDYINWVITKRAPGTYQGSEPTLIGNAEGWIKDGTFYWRYRRRVPDGTGSHTNMRFQDAFWLQADGTAVAHASIQKYGFEVATMEVFYSKLPV